MLTKALSMFKLSKNSEKNISGVKSPIKTLINRVLSKSKHDFGIPSDGGKRTVEDQQRLYAIGRTTDLGKPKITWVDGVSKRSYHQTGMAWDIFIYDEHGACWECIDKYKEVADLFASEFKSMQKEGHFCSCEKLIWGGTWDTPDMPHFEIRRK